jgi:uncharacterized protein (TIGR00730 family)
LPDPKKRKEELFRGADPDEILPFAEEVTRELHNAFYRLRGVGNSVSIFGSSRTKRNTPLYKSVRELAREGVGKHLHERNKQLFGKRTRETRFAGLKPHGIVTGGGPGLMMAANEGARQAKVPSVGLALRLPNEQGINRKVDPQHSFLYDKFFTRKYGFHDKTHVFILAPGGFGTLDEFFEMVVTNQLPRTLSRFGRRTIIAFNRPYWEPKFVPMLDTLLTWSMIDRDAGENIIKYTDDLDVVSLWIQKIFGLR